MRFTVGGDARHYTTVGANAAFLLLLAHVLSFTIMLGSMLAFFVFFFSGHLRTATARYRTFITVRGDTAIYSCNIARGDQPVCCGTFGGKQPFFLTVGVRIFSTAGIGTALPILVRLKLPLPVNTGVILQQSAGATVPL